MTVSELRKMLKKLPADMPVVMVVGEDNIIDVCKQFSEVTTVKYGPEDEEDILLLVPCSCTAELEPTIDEAQLN